jgi:phosphate starvation-inducible PhoH-like protein
VGKSYSAIAYALQMLCEKRIEKIILTRPYVTCDEDYGALPGTLQEKTQPLMQPMMSIIEDFIGKLLTANLIEEGKIEVAPLGFVRGSTYRDCVLIGDEFQNASKSQCYMLLSRIGENAKIILSGDIRQCDINPVNSGLVDLVKRCDKEPDFATVIFDSKDCLRSYMARRVIEIYEKK